jgi:predicted nucleic acid-binding protein
MPSTFVDSNVFVAFADSRDNNHARSVELVDGIRKREYGTPLTSDYVFDEVVTTALVRTGRVETAIKAGKIILGSEEESIPAFARLVRVDEKMFETAWSSFQQARHPALSFTDHTILAAMGERGIDTLVSFDSGFDGVVKRIS